ncbi:MAG: hypothetical protein QGI49_01810, partial [SAR202 cluster bacterium]|nr:hypothetical protein [SAR202 cluster bacterium]
NDLLYTAKSGTITQYTNEGNSIQSVDVGVGSINSLSFSGSTMYFTSNEDTYVYATFVGDTVEGAAGSRSSKGIAYHYTTASSEAALYVLVDGSPKDYILKVDASDGSLITNFSSDGWAPAPSANTEGIEFFSDALWVIANESSGCCDNQRKLYKINKTSGKVTKTYDISNQVNNDIGDITNDGTNLIVYAKSMNDVFTVSTTGGDEGKTWPGGNLNGAKAIAYHPVQQAFYGISGTSMNKFDSSWNDTGASYTLELDPNATSTTAVASVQGATFVDKAPYNDFWFVANGRVFHSYVSQSVTTEPIGLAWSSADAPGLGSAESLWVLVNAEPFDKILRVDTSDGELNTNFDDDGVADAPSGNTEGITFVTEGTDNYLYVVANEGSDQWNRTKYLYKLSAVDASVQAGYPKDLNNVVWDDLGGITYDGEDLVISAKSNSNLWKISTSGDKRVEGWPCCTSGFTQGVKALAYHTGRGVLYGANGTSLLGISSDIQSYESEASLKLDGVNMSGNVHGMTFAGDVLYIARTQSVSSVDTGYITATAFAESMTTKPQGLALSPSTASYQGTSVGSALWVVVDGTPKDRLIKLTLSNSAWSADTDFGSDTTKNGSAELPDSNVTGVTYLGDDGLYVIGGSDTQNPKMYQLSPVNGSVLNTYSLCSSNMMGGPAMGGGGGMDMCNRPAGGLANNGDDRLIVFGSTENTYFFYDTSGQLQDNNPMGHGGADAVDFIQSDSTYWTADDDSIQMWLNPGGDVYNIWQAETYDMGNPNGALENIQGFVVCPKAATGASYPCTTKDMFIGWNDGTDGYISQAVPPSPITNTPRDVAYNADDDVLYILVDGKGADVVVAVDPTTGLVKENSDGEEIFFTLANENANGVAYLNSKVYVSEEEDCGGPGAGCFGPPGTLITVLESDTLAKDTTFNLNTSNGSPGGMDSDGTNLVATAQYGGSRVDYFSPSSGFPTKEVYLWHPTNQGWHEENFSDVAYSTSTPTYFLSKSGMIYRATEDGDIMEEWSITAPDSSVLNTITGLDFVGSSLYIADATTAKIYKALIPLPTITITNTPRAMASASSTLWVAVDAEPVDKILKLAVSTSSATTIASFDSPGTETDGLAIHDGTLWVITNDKISIETPGGGLMQATLPMMYQVDPDTGSEITHGPLMFQNSQMGMGPGQPDVFKDTVGGLASDGQYLYSGTHAQTGKGTPGTLYRIDPSNQMCMNMFGEQVCGPEIRTITQFEGQHTYLDSIQSVEVAPSASYADDRRLIISGSSDTGMEADRISRLDITAAALAQDSVVHSQYSLLDDEGQAGTLDIRGMAVVGTILFMADATNGEIIGTALPENTGVEMTIVGSYTSSLSAVTGSGTHSDTASYSVGRNTNVAVQLTSPSNDFVATTTSATIAGRVSDPAITTVSVGIQLPFTEFLNDEVLLDGTSAALWSVSNQHGSGASQWYLAPGGSGSGCPECGAAGWRFGKQAGYSATGEKTFADGNSRVAGSLTSAEVYPISQGSTLEFTTAWNTEFFPETDIKLVQIAEITQDLAGNDQVGSWQTIGQIVNFVDPFWMPEPEARHDDFQWLIVDPLPFKPNVQTLVEIPLDGLAGKRIKVRFKFDTMDEWANEGRGWFVDDIK